VVVIANSAVGVNQGGQDLEKFVGKKLFYGIDWLIQASFADGNFRVADQWDSVQLLANQTYK
jgi:hypothetical protein